MHEVTVRPGDAIGWVVEHGSTEPAHYHSGAAAEAAARELVRRLSEMGKPARATVILKDGTVAGRLLAT